VGVLVENVIVQETEEVCELDDEEEDECPVLSDMSDDE
jgi:hypothetical protein